MPGASARRKLLLMPTPRTALILLLLLNAVGYVVALATGLVDPLPGLLNGSETNAPLVIWAAQSVGVLLLPRRPGAILTLLACTVSLAAAAFDGDLGAAGLGAGQVAIQLGIAAATLLLWVSTARYGRARCAGSPSSSRSWSSRSPRPRTPSGSSATT
jgi:hypothetical protein